MKQHPEVRRDNATGIVVARDGGDISRPWLTLWLPQGKGNLRYTDAEVGTWPFLNQCHYPDNWVQTTLASAKRREKWLQKENGRLSARIGDLRAQLARERERRRAAEAELRGEAASVSPQDFLPITPEEYQQWLPVAQARVAAEITEQLRASGDLPEDARFEYGEPTPSSTAELINEGIRRATTPATPPSRFGTSCYTTASGTAVHVKDRCTCKDGRWPWGLRGIWGR